MLPELHLNTNNYNTGQTIFYVVFLAAEMPSQLISKKLGPDRWIPIQMVSWSLIASMQAFIKGKNSFYACRALLGLFELLWAFWTKRKLRLGHSTAKSTQQADLSTCKQALGCIAGTSANSSGSCKRTTSIGSREIGQR